jgi:hypothetical protein
VLEFHDGIVGPESLPQFFPQHHLTGTLEKCYEDLEWLLAEANCPAAVWAQLTGSKIKLEILEAGEARGPLKGWHRLLRQRWDSNILRATQTLFARARTRRVVAARFWLWFRI